jgi:acyl-CoA synthetase (NDP forming)
MRNVHSLRPDARVEGVLVSRQVSGGREFLAGVASDPALGHAVVAGLGGIHVETLADIRLAMAPCTPASAREQVARLKSFPLLRGTRGQPALDVDAYVDVLVRLGLLAHDLGSRLVEIDINPLFVFSAGRGVLAVDALVVLAGD